MFLCRTTDSEATNRGGRVQDAELPELADARSGLRNAVEALNPESDLFNHVPRTIACKIFSRCVCGDTEDP